MFTNHFHFARARHRTSTYLFISTVVFTVVEPEENVRGRWGESPLRTHLYLVDVLTACGDSCVSLAMSSTCAASHSSRDVDMHPSNTRRIYTSPAHRQVHRHPHAQLSCTMSIAGCRSRHSARRQTIHVARALGSCSIVEVGTPGGLTPYTRFVDGNPEIYGECRFCGGGLVRKERRCKVDGQRIWM